MHMVKHCGIHVLLFQILEMSLAERGKIIFQELAISTRWIFSADFNTMIKILFFMYFKSTYYMESTLGHPVFETQWGKIARCVTLIPQRNSSYHHYWLVHTSLSYSWLIWKFITKQWKKAVKYKKSKLTSGMYFNKELLVSVPNAMLIINVRMRL